MTVIRWRMRIACWLTKTTVTHSEYIGCPTRYRTRHLFNKFTTNEQLGALQTHTIDTLLFISHTTNVLLFKFRCNILIGVRIIKEMSGSVANGTPCIIIIALPRLQRYTIAHQCYVIGTASLLFLLISYDSVIVLIEDFVNTATKVLEHCRSEISTLYSTASWH